MIKLFTVIKQSEIDLAIKEAFNPSYPQWGFPVYGILHRRLYHNIFDDSDLLRMRIYKIKFWLSIKKAKNCLFSRRNGHKGKIVFGYSIRLVLFGLNII